MTDENDKDALEAGRSAANIKLALFLGVVAFGIYLGFIWYYVG